MLATPGKIVSLNNVEHACRRTGFLPLHAVTANRLRHMYQFLTGAEGVEGGPLDEPANPQLAVCASNLGQNDNHLAGLKPLALAASRGSRTMVMHILKEGQTHENWKWGLISEFSIVLDEIDSGARDGRSVMEIIGARDALKESQCLLLDEFMDGFLFSLFKQKWERFARKIFVIHLLLDAAYLAAVVGLVINRTVLREWG